jgi:serine/threonine protein kinase
MPSTVILKITKGNLSEKTKGNLSENAISFDQKVSLILGRQEDCHIVFSDGTVSRQHCLLEIDPPAVTVKDLGSSNGTYLNGEANDRFSMKTGDCLKLGQDCEITLEIEQEVKKPVPRPIPLLSTLMRNDRADVPKIAGYRTIRPIRRGGMGAVWLVAEETTGKPMALKVMLPEMAADEGCRKRFLREASLSVQLKHEHVVNQFKYGQSGGTAFILMEYCPGESIEQLMIEKGDKLDLNLATHIILQVLDGLHYCHHAEVAATLKDGTIVTVNGVVHRDLKPGNVLLSDHSSGLVAKVADFGLAKAFSIAGLSGMTDNKLIAGMKEFMPSRQIKNFRGAKPAVDVWAAAACYYYMLTGIYPKDFEGKDAYSVVLNDPAVPIRKHNANIPEKLAEIIDTALLEMLGSEEIQESEIIQESESSALTLKKAIESAF